MSALDDLEHYARTRHRHMGRGELMEADAGLGRRILDALVEQGVAEGDLDELVYDAVGCRSAHLSNQTGDEASQDRSFGTGERLASRINNEGMSSQIDFLMNAWGGEALMSEVRTLVRPAAPSPR